MPPLVFAAASEPAATLNAAARDYQRKAQFYLDFVEAENSMGFHASQGSVRILGESINFTRLGQLSLRGVVPTTRGRQQAAALVVPSH